MTDETIIICSSKEGGIELPGSIDATCSECGGAIIVASSGQKIIAEKGAIPVCVDCARTRLKGQEISLVPPSKEQIYELLRELRRS